MSTFQKMAERLRGILGTDNRDSVESLRMRELEDRVVYDAARFSAALESVETEQREDLDIGFLGESQPSDDSKDEQTLSLSSAIDNLRNFRNDDLVMPPPGGEIVFIDERVGNYSELINDLVGVEPDSNQSPIKVVMLDWNQDGIDQISDHLSGYHIYEAVHVVSHGSQAELQLGGTTLTSDNLADYERQIIGWGDGLTETADILLYGCDFARDGSGQWLVSEIASLTSADQSGVANSVATLDFEVVENEASATVAGRISGVDNQQEPAWSEANSGVEIALNHQKKVDPNNLPEGLIANWQMDGINESNEVVELVNGHMKFEHANGNGFTNKTPQGGLNVLKNSLDGTSIGYVIPTDPDYYNDLAQDGSFTESGRTNYTAYSVGQSFGGWTVDSGNIGLEVGTLASSPSGGVAVDLDGDQPGSISQMLNTIPGQQYQLVFSMSGNYFSGDPYQAARVSVGGYSQDFFHQQPDNWSRSNLQWENRSLTFTADTNSTRIQFASLSDLGAGGALISDIRIIQVPEVVTSILAIHPNLSYDAATGKFYKVITVSSDYATATSNANSDYINGVGGQLATIQSNYENDLIRKLAGYSNDHFYLGGTDSTTEGQWNWIEDGQESDRFLNGNSTGSAPLNAFANFGQNLQPDGGTNENCVAINGSTGALGDFNGTDSFGYVIEWNAHDVLSNFTFEMTDNAGGRFAIDRHTGEITVADSSLLDSGTSPIHYVIVDVSDVSGRVYSENILIEVIDDPNDNNSDPTILAGDGSAKQLPTNADWVSDLLRQADQKLVSIGTSSDGITLTRFLEDGSLDTSFGTNGRATATFGVGVARVRAGALQDDGKFLIVGGLDNQSYVARFNSDGSVDTSFDIDGLSQFDLSGTSSEYFNDVVVQSDGKIIAVGFANFSDSEERMTIVRLNSDGSLDISFNGSGANLLSIGPDDDRLNAVTIDGNGRIVAVGQSESADGQTDISVVRFNSDGTLDSTFDGDGIAILKISCGGFAAASSVVIDSSGRIVIGGTTNTVNSESLAVRLLDDGSLDTTFNSTGFNIISASEPHESIKDLALQADGKIVLISSAYTPFGINDVSVIRLGTDGTLDKDFDGDRLTRQPIGAATDEASTVLIDANGDFIVAARTDDITNGIHVKRFNSMGQLDQRFDLDNTTDNNATGVVGKPAVDLDEDMQIFDDNPSNLNEISGGNLTLVHVGGANAGSRDVSGISDFSIMPVNDAPTLTQNSIAIEEGGSTFLSLSELSTRDVDSLDGSLSLVVTNLVGGQFELVSNPGISIDTFTVDQVQTAQIVFVDDGDEIAPSYDIFVTDGTDVSTNQDASVEFANVNDEEQIVTNNDIQLNEGLIRVISRDFLSNTVPNNTPEEIVYTITRAPMSGQLELTSDLGFAVSTFSQDDINNNRLVFAHFGGEASTDYFEFKVDDGLGKSTHGSLSMNIDAVNDFPSIIAMMSPTVDEGENCLDRLVIDSNFRSGRQRLEHTNQHNECATKWSCSYGNRSQSSDLLLYEISTGLWPNQLHSRWQRIAFGQLRFRRH